MKRSNAFTMIELLVAMAVLSVLVVMLLGLVDSASKLWRANESRVDAYREARAALGVIGRDLDNAAAAKNINFIRINADAYPYLADAQKDPAYAGAIFFVTTLPSSAQQTDVNKSGLCQVGYFLAYGKTSMTPGNQAEASLNLYRYLLSSDATLPMLTNSAPPYFNTSLGPLDANVELLARNVTSFRVTQLETNGLAYVPTADAPLPPIVRIEVTAVNQETAKKLRNLNQWINPSGGLENVIDQNKQTFSFKVALQNKP